MKCAVAIAAIVAACGSPKPAHHDPKPNTTPIDAAVGTPLPQGPTPVAHKVNRLGIEAPHAGQIQSITATPEGDAVLTVDEMGGTRLWPSLDGTKEPKLVDLPQAEELALAHQADGYTAVALDQTGGLYIAKLDAAARTLSHVTFGVDPPFQGMVMTAAGLLAWRADHHALLVDSDGAIKGDLPTEPQQRIVDITSEGNKVLAFLEVDGRRKARWVTMQPQLAWGAWIDHPDNGTRGLAIALSPDGQLFATATHEEKLSMIAIYRTGAGTMVSSSPIPVTTEVDIKFIDNSVVAIASPQRALQWLAGKDGATLQTAPAAIQPVRQRHLLAIADGRAILPREGELMLLTQTTTHYLGYQTLSPQITAPGPDGKLLLAGVQGAVLLDASLKEVSRPNLGVKERTQIAAVEWVGGDNWLVESGFEINNNLQLAIVNTASGSTSVVRQNLPELHYLAFEPSTQLVALSFGSQSQIAKLDVGKGTLDQLTKPVTRKPYEELSYSLLSPALAHGQQAVEVTIRDKPTVRWLKTPTQAGTTMTIDGAFLGTDLAGRVYAWHQTAKGALEVGVFTDGKQTSSLPTQGAASIWPDPTATLVAEAALTGVTLYRGSTVLWTRAVEGVGEILWLSDGALAYTHATGIARLDPKTGAITALRCGWEFGLTTKPHPPAPRIEALCTQLSR